MTTDGKSLYVLAVPAQLFCVLAGQVTHLGTRADRRTSHIRHPRHLATATGSPPLSSGAATLYLYDVELTGTAAKLLSDAPANFLV